MKAGNMDTTKKPLQNGPSISAGRGPVQGPSALGSYLIALINMSDHVVEYVVVMSHIPGPNENVPWVKLPNPIPRTCNEPKQQTCFEQHRYVALTTVNCGYTGVVGIAWQQNGQYYAAFTNLFTADCGQHSGTAITLTP
jgi:hypothetical protein